MCGAEPFVSGSAPSTENGPAATTTPRNATVAFALNFLLPGAGLWYLGWPGWGLVNFAGVLAVGVMAALALPDDVFDRHRGLLSAAIAGGSGGLAMALANRRNALGRTAHK